MKSNTDTAAANADGKDKPEGGDVAVGPDLDLLVLEHVFGWDHLPGINGGEDSWLSPGPVCFVYLRGEIPGYSTDLNAAESVLERMALRYETRLTRHNHRCQWRVQFSGQTVPLSDSVPVHLERAEKLPEAICRAALKAVMMPEEAGHADAKPAVR